MTPAAALRVDAGDGAVVLEVLDARALRQWCRSALDLLGIERERIDSLNVFPVADADTGTNLFLTVEAACESIEAGAASHPDDVAAALHDLAHGAFLGARGNSGVILSQILRGMSEAVASAPGLTAIGGRDLALAFARAARSAYDAVSAPADGTILTVVQDVADAAVSARSDDLGEVAELALRAATESLARTPDQMALLRRHGVVDAGGAGLVVLLSALVEVVTGVIPTPAARSRDAGADGRAAVRTATRSATRQAPTTGPRHLGTPRSSQSSAHGEQHRAAMGWPKVEWRPAGPRVAAVTETVAALDAATATASATMGHAREAQGAPAADQPTGGTPAYEVMFLLEAPDDALEQLRATVEPLGESILVVGGDDLWNVHVHTNDVGAVLEAGMRAGRPYRIRVSHLDVRGAETAEDGCADGATRAVVLVVEGEGVAALARDAGATALAVEAGATASTSAVVAAIRDRPAAEVVLIPGGERFRSVVEAAARDVRRLGVRTSVVPVRATVQALAAVAVHDPSRRFDDDVVAMTAAAGATRYAAVTVAEERAITSAGLCEKGDVLGLLEGDVVLIAQDVPTVAHELVERLLGGGGELVTLIHGEDGAALAAELRTRLQSARPEVDCVVYAAGATSDVLLVGVE